MCVCVCTCVCSPGCSLESRGLSSLKVIPMSQDSVLDTDRHTQMDEGCFFSPFVPFGATHAAFVSCGVFKRPGVLFGGLFACDPLC